MKLEQTDEYNKSQNLLRDRKGGVGRTFKVLSVDRRKPTQLPFHPLGLGERVQWGHHERGQQERQLRFLKPGSSNGKYV